MEITYKYRIYPNAHQQVMMAQTFGCCRYVYNRALDIRKSAYESGEKVPSINDCIKMIPQWKADLETSWLKEADSMALQQSLRDLDKAYKNFFRVPGKVGFPKFKSKRVARQSYRTNNCAILDNRHVKLSKLRKVKAKISRMPQGRILSATITQEPSGKYFICLCCTDVVIPSLPKTDTVVGIDLGSRKLATTSDGIMYENPKAYRKAQKKLTRDQRRLSRKIGARKGEKASKNYQKQRIRVARDHERIAAIRQDAAHKMTTALINENQVIVAETLRPSNMIKNHRLAKSVADAAWGEICRQLIYKANWYGRTFVQVDAFYPSSQLCHVCGSKDATVKDLREMWTCSVCGAHHDRDINAAKNILVEGLSMLGWDTPEANACEESVRPVCA